MTGQSKIVFLADRILDDLRMIPRAFDLLERIAANADAFILSRDSFPGELSHVWGPLMRAAIAFCERLAARYGGVVIEEDFGDLDIRDVVFDDLDIARLKLFALDPSFATVAPEALDIVRQCRHIQVLLHFEELRVAA
jgi:hypothetical protein